MPKEPMTLYKLIVLYMLDRSGYPLTRAQIDDCVLEHEYTGYLPLQQALGELEDANMILMHRYHNRTQVSLTDEGTETIRFFLQEVPERIRKEIDEYLKENVGALREAINVTASYKINKKGHYDVTLTIKERDEVLSEIRLNVPDEESAIDLCDRWQEKHESVYQMLVKELLF
ncbi:MAG: DUF4364 family protein [Lachnospiraceae bacterium]|nr:DUF4364 family protein [Lachnospiraceae bacterium]